MLNKVKSRFAEKNTFPFSIIGKSPLRDAANVLNQFFKIKTLRLTNEKQQTQASAYSALFFVAAHFYCFNAGNNMKRYYPQLKRAAFLILLLIVAYYVRRDLPAVLAHPELLRGLAIFSLVALSGLLLALSLQVHKEKVILQKKLGEKTYNWLIGEK